SLNRILIISPTFSSNKYGGSSWVKCIRREDIVLRTKLPNLIADSEMRAIAASRAVIGCGS
ncbi:hypothetical protein L9F63_002767, partial [Diploptera punctata]